MSQDKKKILKNPSRAAFAERVECLISTVGSGNALAAAAGVSEGVIRKWKSGESDPSREHLIALSKAAGVRLEWLATGEGPKNPADIGLATIPRGALTRLISSEYAFIPLYDVRASAGHGAVAGDEEILDLLVINRAWIRQHVSVDPARLSFLYVEGDSMEPLLRPGEMILVDQGASNIPCDGIYVVRIDGFLMVKRVQRAPGGLFIVSSENPKYKPIELQPGDPKDFAVIGRAVWHGRNL